MYETGKDITLTQILEEIKTNRSEITKKIDASETRLLMKIESVNDRVRELESENSLLKQEIEALKRESKKNNIVIFGLDISHKDLKLENIRHHLQTLLEIDIEPRDINNFYRIGKTTKSPIKIEFATFLVKQQVTKNAYKLKGKNINIASEQTTQQREETKLLRHHLFLARQNKNNNCYIKNSRLYINNRVYTPQDLADSEEKAELISKANSAPSTPVPTPRPTPTDKESIDRAHHTTHTSQQNQQNVIPEKNTNTPKQPDIVNRKPVTRQNQSQHSSQEIRIKSRNFK